jgi:tRNA modification GTPase
VIENLGIKRTYEKIQQADIVLLLVDATKNIKTIDRQIRNLKELMQGKKLILVCNKFDLLDEAAQQELIKAEFDHIHHKVQVSAKSASNIEDLHRVLIEASDLNDITQQDVIVSNVRHYEALTKALEAVKRVEAGMQKGISGDFLSQDIRECMHYLGEITGSIGTEEILGTIFSRFCIGK